MSTVTFEEVLPVLRAGGKARRKLWLSVGGEAGTWLWLSPAEADRNPTFWIEARDGESWAWPASHRDILATDWEVEVPE